LSSYTSSSTDILGKTISHYKIIEKIGEGGMGYIYKAYDLNLQRQVALKILPPHLCQKENEKNRFLQEARLLSSLEHPYICTIHDIFEGDEGALYMVMTCYQGKTLRDYRQENQISQEKAISIVKQIASGLIEAHNKGIVHQDIKPENVIITSGDMVKIIDFGVAQLIGHYRKDKNKTSMGTLAYMSPEQTNRISVDHRTDIWSLGIVFYEMLSGKLPFDDEFEQAIVYSILKEEPPKLKQIPKELSLIVSKCLEKDRNNRYQNMREMLTDLEVFLTKGRRLRLVSGKLRN
jgi:serine/threonine-protein kinase